VASEEGARGFYLVGNSQNLNGWNSVAVCFYLLELILLFLASSPLCSLIITIPLSPLPKQALSGKNIVVDSVDSGYITGLRKTLYDYGVTNYTFIPFGSNRLGIVQQGWVVSSGVNYTIAATMDNAIAPYLFSYPLVNLAIQLVCFPSF
jgi:hypothetical protein